MIPEIDIWRAAQLMLKRYGNKALEESAARADELEADNDDNGAAVCRRIAAAVAQLANAARPASALTTSLGAPAAVTSTSRSTLANPARGRALQSDHPA